LCEDGSRRKRAGHLCRLMLHLWRRWGVLRGDSRASACRHAWEDRLEGHSTGMHAQVGDSRGGTIGGRAPAHTARVLPPMMPPSGSIQRMHACMRLPDPTLLPGECLNGCGWSSSARFHPQQRVAWGHAMSAVGLSSPLRDLPVLCAGRQGPTSCTSGQERCCGQHPIATLHSNNPATLPPPPPPSPTRSLEKLGSGLTQGSQSFPEAHCRADPLIPPQQCVSHGLLKAGGLGNRGPLTKQRVARRVLAGELRAHDRPPRNTHAVNAAVTQCAEVAVVARCAVCKDGCCAVPCMQQR
jgi:hypothetical protein